MVVVVEVGSTSGSSSSGGGNVVCLPSFWSQHRALTDTRKTCAHVQLEIKRGSAAPPDLLPAHHLLKAGHVRVKVVVIIVVVVVVVVVAAMILLVVLIVAVVVVVVVVAVVAAIILLIVIIVAVVVVVVVAVVAAVASVVIIMVVVSSQPMSSPHLFPDHTSFWALAWLKAQQGSAGPHKHLGTHMAGSIARHVFRV